MSQNFVEFGLVISCCEGWQTSSIQYYEGQVNKKALFLAICGPKFMKFWEITLSNPVPWLSIYQVLKSSKNDEKDSFCPPQVGPI